jgi:hypothetical protein
MAYAQPILKRDANNNPIQESYIGDMKFRGIYDGSGNLIYKMYARPGSATTDPVWQIARLTYVGTNITQVDWPLDVNGNASSQFIFVQADYLAYSYN